MTALTATDIAAHLQQAEREAGDLGTALARLTGELDQAAQAKDFARAAELKRQADELRPRAMLAHGQAQALRQTLEGLQEHARQEHAAQFEKERQERAQEELAAATKAEKDAVAESVRLLKRADDQIAAARDSLRAALAAEGTAGEHRQRAYQVGVDVGWHEPAAFGVAMPNLVQASVEEKPLLAAVLRATT